MFARENWRGREQREQAIEGFVDRRRPPRVHPLLDDAKPRPLGAVFDEAHTVMRDERAEAASARRHRCGVPMLL